MSSEEMQRAASRMSGAAEEMQRAAANMEGTFERQRAFWDDWLNRLDATLQDRISDLATTLRNAP